MIPHITEMKYVSDYTIWLKFEDGQEGEIDLESELWGEVFEPLKVKNKFNTVALDKELNTICI